MTSITPFEIVLVPFPFTSLTTLKRRPALVASVCQPEKLPVHLVVAMITSQMDGLFFPYDITLKDWERAGLLKPSLVRLSKMVTLEEGMVQKIIGSLTKRDELSVHREFKKMFHALL